MYYREVDSWCCAVGRDNRLSESPLYAVICDVFTSRAGSGVCAAGCRLQSNLVITAPPSPLATTADRAWSGEWGRRTVAASHVAGVLQAHVPSAETGVVIHLALGRRVFSGEASNRRSQRCPIGGATVPVVQAYHPAGWRGENRQADSSCGTSVTYLRKYGISYLIFDVVVCRRCTASLSFTLSFQHPAIHNPI